MKVIGWCLLILVLFCEMGSPESPTVGAFFIEIIIKVEPDVIVMPEGTYKAPLEEIEINSDQIKALNKKYNLISMEKMFARKKTKEEIAKEFPEREARAPEETEEPDIEDTYLLKFPDLVDPKELISKYEKIDEVIYAEENIKVEIF